MQRNRERAMHAARATQRALETRAPAWEDVRVPEGHEGVLLVWNPATDQVRIVASEGVNGAQAHHLLLGAARATYDADDSHGTALALAVQTAEDQARLAVLDAAELLAEQEA